MMGGQRSVAFALACWLAGGCELTPLAAETSALMCSDGLENDGDGLEDCADPDCWSYARCRIDTSDAGPTAVPPPWPEGPSIEPPGPVLPVPPPAADAGIFTPPPIGRPTIDLDASTGDAADDAALPLPCDESCPEGACNDGVCASPEPLGQFRVIAMDVVVPILKGSAECFDSSRACERLFDVPLCCDPDPSVVMHVDGVKVGHLTADDTASPRWQEIGLELELRPGSKIDFDVADDDRADLEDTADDTADHLFSCSMLAEAEMVRAGILRCIPEADLVPPVPGAVVGVTARIVPRPRPTRTP